LVRVSSHFDCAGELLAAAPWLTPD
jgi:hypothetical protein